MAKNKNNHDNENRTLNNSWGLLFEEKFSSEIANDEKWKVNKEGADFSYFSYPSSSQEHKGSKFFGLQCELKVTTGPNFRVYDNEHFARVYTQCSKADVFLIAVVPKEERANVLSEDYKITESTSFCLVSAREMRSKMRVGFKQILPRSEDVPYIEISLDRYERLSYNKCYGIMHHIERDKYASFLKRIDNLFSF